MNFISWWQKQYFTNELHIVLPLENKIHIFAPPCNILYICFCQELTWSADVSGRKLTLFLTFLAQCSVEHSRGFHDWPLGMGTV